MAERSNIEWCDATFNPWIGCTKVSPACDHCYAERDFDLRRHVVQWGAGQARKRTGDDNWKKPGKWNAKPFYECEVCGLRTDNPMLAQCKGPHRSQHMWKPARRRVFCASLADVFDNEVPAAWRQDLFALIEATPNLDWLLLTKRIGNAEKMIHDARLSLVGSTRLIIPDVLPNIWIGATICNQAEADRDIPKLLATPAAVRFLSVEPMLGPISFEGMFANPTRVNDGTNALEALDWIIVGGESGPRARPMHPHWARDLRDQCAAAGVPFLFKQWGEWAPAGAWYETHPVSLPVRALGPSGWTDSGDVAADSDYVVRIGKKAAGRLLDGRTHDGFPERSAP
ncbi:phage Gp37/Gp68 family protein [Methyloversatilis sp. NSM2]|uniref:phage Gp37/Gp68 family protein n=1 Tax=Methyloversatilis sp. NSM2 TaxID=3134135 RepID=UPI003115332B